MQGTWAQSLVWGSHVPRATEQLIPCTPTAEAHVLQSPSATAAEPVCCSHRSPRIWRLCAPQREATALHGKEEEPLRTYN